MKKLIYVMIMALVATLAGTEVQAKGNSDKNEKSFRHTFHRAKNVHRFSKTNGFTEYDFMLKGSYVAAFYNTEGKLVETDYSVEFKVLPERVKQFINSEFAKPAIVEIVKAQYQNYYCYKVRLDSEGKEYSIMSTPEGEIVMGY